MFFVNLTLKFFSGYLHLVSAPNGVANLPNDWVKG
jgi:hypothetical protein